MDLQTIKDAIAKDTIKWIDEQAVCSNYGTDGAVRYYQDAIIGNVKVQIAWDTTAGYDEFNETYNRWQSLINIGSSSQLVINSADDIDNIGDELLDEDQKEEMKEIFESEILDKESYYCNDESNVCDWDDPVAFEIIEE